MKANLTKNTALIVLVLLVVGLYIYISGIESPSNLPKIVIVQDRPQEWADALKLGLHDGIREQGKIEGKDLIVVTKSAAGNPQGLSGLVETVAREDFDVIYTLGTQVTQSVLRATSQKPIVFGAVTDPVKAGLYEGSLDRPKGNITGTQDLWPYPAQFNLITSLLPNAKIVGTVYNTGEVNSQVSMKHIRRECEKRNLELIEKGVTEESQLTAAVAGLLNSKIDVLFIPADNTAQTSSKTIISACMRSKVPVFTGIPGIVENGALGTVGTNYYELGKVNAIQIIEIIGGKAASEIPVRIADKGDLYLNLIVAKDLGIAVSSDFKKKAFKVYE